jgi:hypothetical protein
VKLSIEHAKWNEDSKRSDRRSASVNASESENVNNVNEIANAKKRGKRNPVVRHSLLLNPLQSLSAEDKKRNR